MANHFTATTQIELDAATGSDSNAGGFDSSIANGVDYTYGVGQKTIIFDGSTIRASNLSSSATITITGYSVLAGDAGNSVTITGGTNFTTGVYIISTVSTGSNTWTLNAVCTTAAGSAMTGVAGGALATPGQAAANIVSAAGGCLVNVKVGTYTLANGAINTSGQRVSSTVATTYWRGYQTTHNDGGTKPIFQAGANSMTLFSLGNFDMMIENIEFQANGHTTLIGLVLGGRCIAKDIKISSFDMGGLTSTSANCLFVNCEASGITGGQAAIFSTGSGSHYYHCWAHGNSVPGFKSGVGDSFINCVSSANSNSGFNINTTRCLLVDCLAYGNTGVHDGFSSSGTNVTHINCISVNNGTSGSAYGFNSGAAAAGAILINCAGFGNRTADTNGTFLINKNFTALSADPTINGGSNNFSPNIWMTRYISTITSSIDRGTIGPFQLPAYPFQLSPLHAGM